MKIAHFVRFFPYEDHESNRQYFGAYGAGGSPLSSYYLIRELAGRGNDITVYTTAFNSKNVVEDRGNLVVHRFGTSAKYMGSSVSPRLMFASISSDMPDIVHAHFDIPPGPAAAYLFSRKKHIPLVLTYHGDWISEYGGPARRISVTLLNKFLVGWYVNNAKALIVPSQSYAAESRFLWHDKSKITPIPNGVDADRFDLSMSKDECRERLGLPLKRLIVLFLSSLQPFKGPDVLIRALPMIRDAVPDVFLVIAGQGWMAAELASLAKELGVERNVRFLGYVEDTEKKAMLMKSADVFAFPSLSESFGNVGLEAMASGIPVVASRVGGIPDVVLDGQVGLLVSPRDSKSLADAIARILVNKELGRELGEAGYREARKYSWSSSAIATERVYMNVLA